MCVKVYFLHSHVDYFPDNLGAVSEELGERLHQDIKTIEKRYQGYWSENMMADYCWCLIRECTEVCETNTSVLFHFLDLHQLRIVATFLSQCTLLCHLNMFHF